MRLRDQIEGAVSAVASFSADIWDRVTHLLAANLDAIASVSSLVAAIVCIYLSAVILRERTPLVDLQRWSLGFLAVALMSNSLYDFPDWLLVNGHRPTGAAVDVSLMANVIVMAVRGSIIYQPHHPHRGEVARLD